MLKHSDLSLSLCQSDIFQLKPESLTVKVYSDMKLTFQHKEDQV